MSCGCIAKVKAALAAKYHSPIDLPVAFVSDGKGGAQETFAPIMFYYHTRNMDGSLSKTARTGQLPHAYCPMCGVRMRTQQEGN
jgi:hypothetical protein